MYQQAIASCQAFFYSTLLLVGTDGHNRGRRNANQHQANYVDAMPVDGDQADAM